MNLIGHTPNGLGIANGAIMMALLDHMLADGMIRPMDVRTILTKAADGLAPWSNIIAVKDAQAVIRDKMLPRFAQKTRKED